MPSNPGLYQFCNRGLALVFILRASAAGAGTWDQLPTDKAAHFGLSSVAVEASMKTCQAFQGTASISIGCRSWSTGLVLTAGLLKEVADERGGRTFDQQDLVADLLGVVTGNLLQWQF